MLLRGEGRYTDDVSLPGQAYAVMVRSRNAHGVIRAIDVEAARKMPGVLGVYTAADLKGYGPLKCIVPFKNRDGSPMKKPRRGALATDKVRYVGDPVAFVVAETVLAAKDAAEAVSVEIEPLAAVTSAEEAAREGAPLLYDDVPGNVALDYHYGDAEAVERRLRCGGARHAVAACEQPRRRQRHGAARGAGVLRRQSLHALRRLAGRLWHARQHRRGARRRRQGRARPERPGRRLVRHEGRGVSRIYLRAARRACARPAGEVDRRALGKFCLRQPRPQPRCHRRARARRRRQLPRRALDELRQYGRVPFAGRADPGHAQRREERAGHVSHAADRSLDQVRVHHDLACLRLPRRRPARGQLLYGAADRRGRGGAGHRSHCAAPAQSDSPAGLALQNRLGRDL